MTLPQRPNFLVIQVISKRQQLEDVVYDLDELRHLVDTFGGVVSEEMVQRLDHPDPNSYIGRGKLESLKEVIREKNIHVVLLNDMVKPGQMFRIEKELWEVSTQIAVWDRLDLILNIFDQHATTTESKLQIQLARISHMGPRFYGLGGSELSRQGGGIGTRGKGETNIEFEQRKVKLIQQKLKKQLKQISQQKQDRVRFRKEQGFGPVALVGYTSAGKTTLFNTLTGKSKKMHAGLFTTLDTVVGKMKTAQLDQPVLISDTIGFINNLPPILLDSFKSTLLESLEAKLILHVVDASDLRIKEKIEVVQNILNDLKITQPIYFVFNKIDQISQERYAELQKEFEIESAFFISAKDGEGIEFLKEKISLFFINPQS